MIRKALSAIVGMKIVNVIQMRPGYWCIAVGRSSPVYGDLPTCHTHIENLAGWGSSHPDSIDLLRDMQTLDGIAPAPLNSGLVSLVKEKIQGLRLTPSDAIDSLDVAHLRELLTACSLVVAATK